MFMEKEKERLVQYAVFIKEGENAEKRQEFYAPKAVIERFFKSYTFAGGSPRTKHTIDMTHIVFEGDPKDIKNYINDCIKKNKTLAKAEFIEGELGSLELEVNTEEDAVKCLKYLKLR